MSERYVSCHHPGRHECSCIRDMYLLSRDPSFLLGPSWSICSSLSNRHSEAPPPPQVRRDEESGGAASPDLHPPHRRNSPEGCGDGQDPARKGRGHHQVSPRYLISTVLNGFNLRMGWGLGPFLCLTDIEGFEILGCVPGIVDMDTLRKYIYYVLGLDWSPQSQFRHRLFLRWKNLRDFLSPEAAPDHKPCCQVQIRQRSTSPRSTIRTAKEGFRSSGRCSRTTSRGKLRWKPPTPDSSRFALRSALLGAFQKSTPRQLTFGDPLQGSGVVSCKHLSRM